MGQSRSWLLDDRLTDIRYHSGTAPKIALNAPRSEEVKAWVIKRDELLQGWSENDLLDLEEIWSRAATGENKIAMVPPRSPLLPGVCAIYANTVINRDACTIAGFGGSRGAHLGGCGVRQQDGDPLRRPAPEAQPRKQQEKEKKGASMRYSHHRHRHRTNPRTLCVRVGTRTKMTQGAPRNASPLVLHRAEMAPLSILQTRPPSRLGR